MRRRTIRISQTELDYEAKIAASEQQKPVLEKLMSTGFVVTKVLRNSDRCAISLDCRGTFGCLTHDGVFHRPVKGKKTVSVNNITLERVW